MNVMADCLKLVLLISCVSLYGCFSLDSDDDDDDTPEDSSPTTYTIDVDTTLDPSSKGLFSNTVSARVVNQSSFSVVVVNTAGEVTEIIDIPSANINQNSDGQWEISIPGDPRLDRLIVADPAGSLTITQGSDIDTDFSDVLFAPTTREELAISIASTAAYQNFLENIDDNIDFSTAGFDVSNTSALEQVGDIIEQVKDIIDELVLGGDIDFSALSDISEAIAAIEAKVTDIVSTEIENAKSEVDTVELSTLFTQGGGGFSTFDMEMEVNTENGTESWDYVVAQRFFVPETGIEQSFGHEADAGQADNTSSWTDSTGLIPSESDELELAVLGSGEWQQFYDSVQFESSNADGSVIFKDAFTNSFRRTLNTVKSIDLSTRNIKEYIAGTENASIAPIVTPSATFAANAQAHLVDVVYPNETYILEIYYEASRYNAGTVESGSSNNFGLSDFLSESASSTAASLKGFIIEEMLFGDEPDGKNTYLVAELINNTEKTANIYLLKYNPSSLDIAVRLGQTTWSYKTLLTSNDAIYISNDSDLFENIGNYDGGNSYTGLFFHAYNNKATRGYHWAQGATEKKAEWIYNSSASSNIVDSIDFTLFENHSSQ